jgi:hypothetical protein
MGWPTATEQISAPTELLGVSAFDPTATFGPALHLFPSVASIDYSIPLLEGLQPRG